MKGAEMADLTTVPPTPALPAKVIKLKVSKKARNRREEDKLRLYMQARAGDVGARAEWQAMGLRDLLMAGDHVLPNWLEELTGLIRKLRRAAGKKTLIGRKKAVA
jgi:hypothetical protein